MHQEVHESLKKFKAALIEHMPKDTTSVTVTLTAQGLETSVTSTTAEELKAQGIAMRNLAGEWIK